MSTNNVNIVNTNNWFHEMNIIGNQNVTNMVLSGTNPNMQMLLINSANDEHHCYSNYQLSKTNGFTLTFQLYITGTNMNSICAYFGVTDSNFDANSGLSGQSGAVELRIAPATPIFQLFTNYGSSAIVATSATSVATGAWQTVKITYTPSSVGTWIVDYNGTNVISYNDTLFTSFANNQNTFCGLYGSTSQNVQASIRAIDLSVKQSMPLSAFKNTYSFYPEECFINKLSTHSQNNVGAAFGLRLLNASYLGPIINVRRGSDNATLDFYADSKGNIARNLYGNGQALLTWLAGSIGYVTRWYDQTGNGRDVIQATTSEQPKIGTPILDTMSSSGKSAARGIYALYRANSSYTGATIRLRRSADSVTSDFYADIYGNLTDASGTSFTSWISSSTAYVDTWYDQSGSGNHATQSTTANQPVYNGTLKLIDSLNSSSLFLNMPSGTVPTGTLNAPYSFVFRHGSYNNNVDGAFIGAGAGSNNQSNVIRLYSGQPNGYSNYWYDNDLFFGTNTAASGNTVAITYTGTVHNAYVNGTLSNTNSSRTGGTTAAGQQYLFRVAGGEYLNGQMYSVFIFGSALSDSDRMACTGNPTDLNIKYDGTQSLYNGSSVPLTAGLDNYTYVCNYTPMTSGYSVIVEQGSNPLVDNTRAAFVISNTNSLYFAGHANDTTMHNISYYTPRKTVVICNHNLNTGNVVVNDNGTTYSYTTTSPSALALAASVFCIGRNCQGGEFYTGNINEVIVFRNTLTAKESMLYFTPNAITRKDYRSQPVLQIKDVPKDISPIPSGAIVALDTQMLANMSPGALVTSWNDFTGYNSPVINAGISGTGNALTIPPFVSFSNGSIISSSGTGKYLNGGSKTFNINTNGGFTAVWYGAYTTSINTRILDFANGSGIDNILVGFNGGSVYFQMFNGVGRWGNLAAGGAVTQNEYAVFTFRYTASSRLIEILKNDVLLVAETAGVSITDRTVSNTYINRSNWDGDTYGSLNTVGLYVYDRYLTDTQVASVSNHLMNCTTSTMPSTLPDYNNKVVRFGSVLSQGYRGGQSMRFSGRDTSSYLDIQDVPNYPLTFGFWFYNINSSGAASMSLGALCSADLGGLGIQIDIINSGTTIAAAHHNGSGYTVFTNSTIALNTWYHIAFVVTPTTAAYYLNGSLIQSVSTIIYNTNRIIIGKSGDNARPFNGYIADIRVFDYALRADEISNIYNYIGQAGQEIMNYNTPTNYIVNMSNWYSFMNIYKTGSFTIVSDTVETNVQYQLTNGTANASNTIFNSTRIQNYNTFVCSFLAYIGTATDHGYYFYCGATSSTTVPTGTLGTSANSSYYIYFQITGTTGIYLFNDQGQQLAYSPLPSIIASDIYIPITIVYNRSTRNTWTVNVASIDVLTYNDPNNENWVSNIAGDIWGIGARTTTSGMTMYIRRVELSYTPFVNSINTTVNAQNNTKFPPGAMTAASTTFTGTSILDGVYTATASNSNYPAYNAFDNSTGSFTMESGSFYNGTLGAYSASITTTTVTNLTTGISTSYGGEWLQIQVPNAVCLNSFSLMGRQDQSLFIWRTPNTFYVVGSNDGSTWRLVHSTSGAQFTSAMQYFTCNAGNTNKYRYFRLITTKVGNNGPSGDPANDSYLHIAAWDLFTQMNTVNANVIAVPPYSMTADTTTFAGSSVYDGTYTVTSSNTHSFPTMGPRYVVFDNTYGSSGNSWSPGQYHDINTGVYIGSVSTTVSGVSQSGEWIQMELPNPIVLYSFSLNFWWGAANYVARSFLIAASNDNTTWTNIYDNSNITSFVYGTAQTFVVTGPAIAYRYFRLIVRRAGKYDSVTSAENVNEYNYQSWWVLDQWKLYTNASNFNLMKFPPAPLTADSISIPGNSIVSGNYIASASTAHAPTIASHAFDDPIKNELWHSEINYTNGLYTGVITTTVSGTSYSGDWLQLQAPNALQLSSFSIYPRQDDNLWALRSPKNFVMAGSNDGSTWYLLHTATGVSDWSSADKYFVCNGNSVASKYTYFRLVVMSLLSGESGANSVQIQNLSLFTPMSMNTSITPATPKGLLDGLTWKYFHGESGNLVSYYTTNTYRNIGRFTDGRNVGTITSGQYIVNGGDYYSMEIFGYFRASVSGTYTFTLTSDNGSYLWIGSNALVGYTTSNATIQIPIIGTASGTVTLLAGTYYPMRIHCTEQIGGDDLQFSFTPPGGTQIFNGQGFFFSGTGVDSAFPQESAKIIKDLTNTNKDGIYYILVNGISTPIHCLMNDCYDGGGWMMLMKGTRGNAFQYDANYWTAENTLNAGDTTRSDADAKYNTFNYSTVKDVLAIWPDIPSTSYTNVYGQNGGSIFVSDGWTWMVNNWNETTRTTPLTGFNTARAPHKNSGSIYQTYGINNPFRYNGFGNWCSNQPGAYLHAFSEGSNKKIRWGFLFNNETTEYVSSDVLVGIGMGGSGTSYSAGDLFECCGTSGINRSARFELYGR